ncbi:phosphonate ABC transporter ATP-binding protein [Marinobacterium aestuarii]|uniref:Phosphonate ABC transporter ATP-binding protein n=1 Tax=Marinobacterium aestuarii TaxID=1821621 RepID=A0A1A9F116_9GAMM|nr:phosphonate ABC transporter ATP-binding protein [Marinobacterium aestuarii]ANG63782.1 phosphonate ABC transporter ATP-binding protein [Marinobacterium aestuarii]
MHVIDIHSVRKSFTPSQRALCDVDLQVSQGEMVALIGPSGSGKSTLLRHISGLTLADRQSQGHVQVLGRDVQRNGRLQPGVRQSRARIGHVFQQFNLIGRLSVLNNVLIGGLSRMPVWRSLTGRFTQAEQQDALDALARVGMADFARQRASTLSGGQQQRVAIARTLMQRAEIILADEPIASLDPESSRLVMETLRRINQDDGITVVVTLHQVDYARSYCDRAVALRHGQLQFDGPMQDLGADQLAQLYRGLPDTQPHLAARTPATFTLSPA